MPDVPSTDDVRDIWVDHHLNPLPRAEGIALVPEYQAAFDAWLETIRADEREAWLLVAAIDNVRMVDLRASVAALPDDPGLLTSGGSMNGYRDAIQHVLDLFDGMSHG